MTSAKINQIKLINGSPVNFERSSFGCEGFILCGDQFSDINVVNTGYSEEDEEVILSVFRCIVGTDSDTYIKSTITSILSAYGDERGDFTIDNALGLDTCGTTQGEFNLLSNEIERRSIILLGSGKSVIFYVNGSRIRVDIVDASL